MESVSISQREYFVVRLPSNNKTAIAKLKNGEIQISIPKRWSEKEQERIFQNLKNRAIKAILNGKWNNEPKSEIDFENGQEIDVLGNRYRIEIVEKESGNVGLRKENEQLKIFLPARHNHIRNEIVKKVIIKSFAKELSSRVEQINNRSFQSTLGKVRIRDADSRWGSCSSKNDIMISLRLLFMPLQIIDYVIVHELAHTKYRGHGIRFWQLVEKVMPEYREIKKWLKENGNRYPKKQEQKSISEFIEEPY